MAIGYTSKTGQDFDLVFAPNLSGLFSAASNLQVGGVDLNTRYELLSYGSAAAATGYDTAPGGADVNTLWAAIGTPIYNNPLPIQGLTMGQAVFLPGAGSGSAQIAFLATISGWTVNGSSFGGSSTSQNQPQSGSIPSGAVSVQVVASLIPGDQVGTPTNTAASATALSGTGIGFMILTSGTGTPGATCGYNLTINFFNASGTNISQTTCIVVASRGP